MRTGRRTGRIIMSKLPRMECDSERRRFVAAGGACAIGALLGFHLHSDAAGPSERSRPFDAWIRILPDGRIVLLVAKAEMGQGVWTALPMVLAEELDVAWSGVEVQQAPIDPLRYDHLTVGSNSVQSLWLPLRLAGAAARRQLVRAAAIRWKVSPDACHTDNGTVIGPRQERVSYADLAPEASVLIPDQEDAIELRSAERFRIVGHSHRRVEAPTKVNGTAIYGLDVRVPGMLQAVIARCPIFGGQLRSFNPDAALSVGGVEAVFPIAAQGHDAFTRGGVAIVAQNSWAALQGRRKLDVSWGQSADSELSSESILASLLGNVQKVGPVVEERGDTLVRLAGRGRIVEATFELPFLAHVTMEPMNGTVHVRADSVEAWLPTQNAADARAAIARVLRRPVNSVTVHQTMVGGAFGRRDATDYAVEAAQIAALAGAPVQLFWSREDDLQCDRYRPMAVHSLRASLDSRGLPNAWLDRMSSVSIGAFLEPPESAKPAETEVGGARSLPYDLPAFRLEYTPVRCAVPVGWWRSVEDSLNGFSVECFIEDLAAAASLDSLDYRLALLPEGRRVPDRDGAIIETDRLRRVLIAVAEQARWKAQVPAGRARGLACHSCRGSYIAVVAEVSIVAGGVIVHHIWAAGDCGMVVNPLGVETQIEGGLLFATSAALYEVVTVKDGRVQQSNFNDYRVLRIDASPAITLRILPSNAPPTGAGELAVPPVAPAIANAIFGLTGHRPRRLPIQSLARCSVAACGIHDRKSSIKKS
jgi:isoquinoline 1-oxidoreductase subunit beta